MSSKTFTFDELVSVRSINPDGKKFDKGASFVSYLVSRCVAANEEIGIECVFDFHDELISIGQNSVINVVLIKEVKDNNFFEKYDYAMFGIVYSLASTSEKDTVHVSFGGLLMMLSSLAGSFSDISIGSKIYMLIKRK